MGQLPYTCVQYMWHKSISGHAILTLNATDVKLLHLHITKDYFYQCIKYCTLRTRKILFRLKKEKKCIMNCFTYNQHQNIKY